MFANASSQTIVQLIKPVPQSIHYITASCILRNNHVLKDGKQLFFSDKEGIEFLHAAYNHFTVNYPKFYKMDALGKLGIIAIDVLLKEVPYQQYLPQETGIVLTNRNASIEADVNYYRSVSDIPSPALFVYTLPNIVIGEISIRYKFKGENAFFINEVFDADWLHFYLSDLLEHRNLQACLGGWIDVVDNQYEAFIFYVERVKRQGSLNFTAQNLEQLYRQ